MDLGLTGKVAVVGGGSRGSGRAIAVELATEGVKVVVAARTEGPVQETVDLVRRRGGAAVGVACDMTTPEGAHAAAEAGREHFGLPDIAISNVYPGDAPYRMGDHRSDRGQDRQPRPIALCHSRLRDSGSRMQRSGSGVPC
jgi:NAD(P)-dependent dehydrogenase (short-subunit alcohol dehydrogenase family)